MMGKKEYRYLFGPVPSRRLGRSLGVDIVPMKTCTLDCVYCQLGKTSEKRLERKTYVPLDAVISELKAAIEAGIEADYITISGSGEPTLNSQLGLLIEEIKKITDIPVAILTNGTLLTDPAVRADCSKADLVLPSLDAGDEQTFRKINRPHKDLSFDMIVEGLVTFREEFSGQIWLEVFLIEDFNTDIEQIRKIKTLIDRIKPDKVQLNTIARPTTEQNIKPANREKLLWIAEQLGPNAEVISAVEQGRHIHSFAISAETVLAMLKRRPCSLDDICSGLGLDPNEAIKQIAHLQQQGLVETEQHQQVTFFKAK
jgi:wyosine [tRNA(Phe)-imidazoG37] synthetase (radical SAM superfamily)